MASNAFSFLPPLSSATLGKGLSEGYSTGGWEQVITLLSSVVTAKALETPPPHQNAPHQKSTITAPFNSAEATKKPSWGVLWHAGCESNVSGIRRRRLCSALATDTTLSSSPPTLSALTTSRPSRTSTASSGTPIGYLLTVFTRYVAHPQTGIYVEHPFLRDSHPFVTASDTSHPHDSSIYGSTRRWTFVFHRLLASRSSSTTSCSLQPCRLLAFPLWYNLTSNTLVPA
ncbi:hypothetical protein Moror_9898 [Moniliophthora roreri MCA 2997]|uniref:Uncharacterized protein n=1 Tax=Moniliophthora roreri (strain MCA 2997) TaxID=1381753 RepID=V2WZV6_MONRO|nr:hypothetical protein Moror_9898 [Moniliophthora roreri MCA 2997]